MAAGTPDQNYFHYNGLQFDQTSQQKRDLTQTGQSNPFYPWSTGPGGAPISGMSGIVAALAKDSGAPGEFTEGMRQGLRSAPVSDWLTQPHLVPTGLRSGVDTKLFGKVELDVHDSGNVTDTGPDGSMTSMNWSALTSDAKFYGGADSFASMAATQLFPEPVLVFRINHVSERDKGRSCILNHHQLNVKLATIEEFRVYTPIEVHAYIDSVKHAGRVVNFQTPIPPPSKARIDLTLLGLPETVHCVASSNKRSIDLVPSKGWKGTTYNALRWVNRGVKSMVNYWGSGAAVGNHLWVYTAVHTKDYVDIEEEFREKRKYAARIVEPAEIMGQMHAAAPGKTQEAIFREYMLNQILTTQQWFSASAEDPPDYLVRGTHWKGQRMYVGRVQSPAITEECSAVYDPTSYSVPPRADVANITTNIAHFERALKDAPKFRVILRAGEGLKL